MAEDDVLVFIHIPKTAGISLIKILDEQFEPHEIFPVHSMLEAEQIGGLQLSQPKAYRFVRGHFRFGPFDDCIYRYVVQNPILITMLRDPIERTISSYRFVLRRPQNRLHAEFFERGVTLLDFVTLPEYAPRSLNHQARQIAGSFTAKENQWATEDPHRQQILLQVATERLEQFAFVGIMERFRESVEVLSWLFGWDLKLDDLPYLNVAPSPTKKEDLAPAELEAVRAANEADLKIYDLALERFERQHKAMRLAR